MIKWDYITDFTVKIFNYLNLVPKPEYEKILKKYHSSEQKLLDLNIKHRKLVKNIYNDRLRINMGYSNPYLYVAKYENNFIFSQTLRLEMQPYCMKIEISDREKMNIKSDNFIKNEIVSRFVYVLSKNIEKELSNKIDKLLDEKTL